MCGYKLHIRSLYSKIDLQSSQRGFISPFYVLTNRAIVFWKWNSINREVECKFRVATLKSCSDSWEKTSTHYVFCVYVPTVHATYGASGNVYARRATRAQKTLGLSGSMGYYVDKGTGIMVTFSYLRYDYLFQLNLKAIPSLK